MRPIDATLGLIDSAAGLDRRAGLLRVFLDAVAVRLVGTAAEALACLERFEATERPAAALVERLVPARFVDFFLTFATERLAAPVGFGRRVVFFGFPDRTPPTERLVVFFLTEPPEAFEEARAFLGLRDTLAVVLLRPFAETFDTLVFIVFFFFAALRLAAAVRLATSHGQGPVVLDLLLVLAAISYLLC